MHLADFNPLQPVDCGVVDADHVAVRRSVDYNGGRTTVRFVKQFKSTGGYDFSWFNTHEAELLLDLKQLNATRVVQPAVQGSELSFAGVQQTSNQLAEEG